MDRGAWWATVHRTAQSRTRLNTHITLLLLKLREVRQLTSGHIPRGWCSKDSLSGLHALKRCPFPGSATSLFWGWTGFSHVQLFVTPWTAACQASLSMANFLSLLKLMSIESVMPSNHLILCCPLLLLHSIFPSIREFSYESTLQFRWTKGWSFRFSISPSSDY